MVPTNENMSEATDETVTTTDGDGERLRSAYPPEEPAGVEDPSRRADGSIAPDDAVTREWRREDGDQIREGEREPEDAAGPSVG